MVSVGTIVWLASELMFFAALFAMLLHDPRSVAPEPVGSGDRASSTSPSPPSTPRCWCSSSVTCQLGVFAAERGQVGRSAGLRGRQVGAARVVRPDLPDGRVLHRAARQRVHQPDPRRRHDPVVRLRLDLLPHHRLPRAPRDRRADRVPVRARAHLHGQALHPRAGRDAPSSSRTTGTSSTSCGSACSPPSTCSSSAPPRERGKVS